LFYTRYTQCLLHDTVSVHYYLSADN